MNRRSFLALIGLVPVAVPVVASTGSSYSDLQPAFDGEPATMDDMLRLMSSTYRTYEVDLADEWADVPVSDDWHCYDE